MQTDPAQSDRLNSWKEIAAYVGRDVRTVIRWEQRGGLPVYRVPVGQRQAVYAYRSEIDAWLEGHADGSVQLAAALELAHARATRTDLAAPAIDHAPIPATVPVRARSQLWPSAATIKWIALAALVVISGIALRSMTARHDIVITGVAQLTNDGTDKVGLIAGGRRLYFGRYTAGRIILSTVGEDGGPIHEIPTPFVKTMPEAISADGSRLLVLAWDGEQRERDLWIVPVAGGSPRRVGNVKCHSAAWSPNGQHIAFANADDIDVTNEDGKSVEKVQSFTVTPRLLRWSPDGKRLRFELTDLTNSHSSFWELSFTDQNASSVSSLAPLHIDFSGCCESSTSVGPDDRSFVTGGESAGRWIEMILPDREFWRSHMTTARLNLTVQDPHNITLDPRSRHLFVSGESLSSAASEKQNNELFWLNPRSHEFRPFLPGIPADDVDFSRDGDWIVWHRTDDQTLWISHPDGTEPRLIHFPAGDTQLPRWSPDGRQIAFTAKLPDQIWRIYVVSATEGATARQAGKGSDSQGAPTWSPDGRSIVYGNVWCRAARTCAIHEITLSTGEETTIPGSEGLETARWSPDGRWIAALQPELQLVKIYDVKAKAWRTLVSGVNGNDLRWSFDSRYLYASNPNGNNPMILRVSPAEGSVVPAVELSAFSHLPGRVATWFALAPDNSIIFILRQQPAEIYSLAYDEK